MNRVTISQRNTLLILCVVMLGILLSTNYFISPKVQLNSTYDLRSLDDFNFRLNFNTYGRDQIDTYNGTFTKDLVLDGTKTINFKIPEDVKEEIYKLMTDIDVLSLPEILKVDGMSVTPSCDYKLKVTIKGKTKTITWKEGFFTHMNVNLPKENENFIRLVKYISDYIYDTDEYQKLPEANGGYD